MTSASRGAYLQESGLVMSKGMDGSGSTSSQNNPILRVNRCPATLSLSGEDGLGHWVSGFSTYLFYRMGCAETVQKSSISSCIFTACHALKDARRKGNILFAVVARTCFRDPE